MKLTHEELEFLSAWAREEWEPACYQLPAHRLQISHGVSAAQLVLFIKAWTEAEGKKDQEILSVSANPQPRWPWSSSEEFSNRFADANRTLPDGVRMKNGIGTETTTSQARHGG